MKHKKLIWAIIGLVAITAAGFLFLGSREGQQEVFSRFAPLAPEGFFDQANNPPVPVGDPGPVVVASSHNDVSPALSAIPPIPPKIERPDPDLNELRPLGAHAPQANRKPQNFTDPVWQDSIGQLPSVSIAAPLQNFEGVNNVNGVLPPDTNGDVGPSHYVQWVNLSFAIYSKSGALLYGPAAGNTLWSGFGGPCQTTNNGDPIVQYDHLADRWMMSQFALPNYPSGPFYQCIAVSQTNNPTGAWYRYQFQISSSKLNDYPHFGVWPDGYYMSINQFVGNSWGGAGAVAFERDKMLLGQPAQMVYFDLYNVDPNLGGMLPSDLDGPAPAAGTANVFAQMDDDAYGYSPDQLQLWNFHVNWTNPGASTFTKATALPTAAFDANMCGGSRNCIPQQGTTRGLDAIADRLMYRLQYRSFGDHQTLVLNHTVDVNSTDRAGVRWYELRNYGSGWSIYQQGTFSPDANRRWMASAAMDASGNIGIGYSVSNSTMYPAIRYTGRLAGDALGQMTQGEGTIINGTGSQTHTASRWGDYSMLALDPDGCTFWYTNEYLQVTGSAPWRTRIGSFILPGCGTVPTTGTLQGTVTDASTSAAISGATVTIVGGASTTTNGSGFYQFTNVTPNTYSVTASATGYNSSTANGVTVTAGNTTTQDFALTAVAPTTGTLQGTVTDASTSAAISGATVTIVGGASTTTDGSGFYQFTDVTPNTYSVTASNSGYDTATNTGVVVTAGNTTTSDFALNPSVVSSAVIYLSSSTNGNAGGVAFNDEDIVAYNTGTGAWSMVFDGSDVGVTGDVNAFAFMSDGSILMSIDNATTIGSLGTVDDSDIVQFHPTSLGANTTGTFTVYFDGSDVGLSTNNEDIDTIAFAPDGRLVISTIGGFSVPGVSGNDEDLIAFSPTSLGTNTSGTWALYFDGSDVGLNDSASEDVTGSWIDPANNDIYLTTLGSFSVPGVSGDGADIFICTPSSLGSDTACTYSLYWDGSANGFGGEVADGVWIEK